MAGVKGKMGGREILCCKCGDKITTTGNHQKYCEVCREIVVHDQSAFYYLNRLIEDSKKEPPQLRGGDGGRCGT